MFKKTAKSEKEQAEEWPKQVTGETISLQSVENFFKYTINPHLIETKIEKQSMALARERGGLNPQLIVLVILVIIGGAVAYSMVANQFQNSDWINKYTACATQLAAKGNPVVTITSTASTTQSPGIVIK